MQVDEGERFSAETVVINVGAQAAVPKLPGLDTVPWKDNASVMELRQIPRHLLVLGGGYIGCEMAQMFRRFGAAVTIVGTAPHLLPHEDEDLSRRRWRRCSATRASSCGWGRSRSRWRRASTRTAPGRRSGSSWPRARGCRAAHLLVATGRRPNTDDLGCEAAGIALRRGRPHPDRRPLPHQRPRRLRPGRRRPRPAVHPHELGRSPPPAGRADRQGGPRPIGGADAVDGVHRSPGGRRRASASGRRRSRASPTRWRRCRSATSPGRSRPGRPRAC